MNNNKEKILSNIKSAVKTPSKIPVLSKNTDESLYDEIKEFRPKNRAELWGKFKTELETVNGQFTSVESIKQAAELITEALRKNNQNKIMISDEKICSEIAYAITEKFKDVTIINALTIENDNRKITLSNISFSLVNAGYAVAETGSLAFIYEQTHTSYPHFLAENVYAVVREDNIVADLFELFEKVPSKKAKDMVIVTGPSRTADIEKILILGAHGPKELFVIAVP